MKEEMLRIRISPELKKKLNEKAKSDFTTMSELVTRLIVQELKSTK